MINTEIDPRNGTVKVWDDDLWVETQGDTLLASFRGFDHGPDGEDEAPEDLRNTYFTETFTEELKKDWGIEAVNWRWEEFNPFCEIWELTITAWKGDLIDRGERPCEDEDED